MDSAEIPQGRFPCASRRFDSETDEGSAYLDQVRAALKLLTRPQGLKAAPNGTKLGLAVTPTFSRQILLPKLVLSAMPTPTSS